MTNARAPLFGWGAFLLLAIAAAFFGQGAQLGFAAAAIGLLGLPHGASDLAIVAAKRRRSFLVAYLAAIGAVLLIWVAAPMIGLLALLVCSAVHFALDDEEQSTFGWARGIGIVAAPAILHRNGLMTMFADLTRDPVAAGALADVLRAVGVIAAGLTIFGILRRTTRDDHRPMVTIAAVLGMVALPPLVGFTIGFVMLHAARQTHERRRELGCATVAAYIGRIAPVLAGAAIVLIGVAVLFLRGPAGEIGLLFAGIAALAMPHMLVTPFWHGSETATRVHLRGAAVRL